MVKQVGAAFYYPGIFNPSDLSLRKEGQAPENAKLVRTNVIDEDLLQTLDIKPVAGRLYSQEFHADTNRNIIINEAAVKEIGFESPQKAVGNKVYFDWRGDVLEYNIVGVIKDFHFKDLHVPIEPYGFFLNDEPNYSYMIVHAVTKDMSSLLKMVESRWHALNPNEPFEYSFLDQDFYKNYEAEDRLMSIVGYFTILAILISCLGLFGLSTFSVEQRTKEIGIRKVLGASVSSIFGLMSKDFLKLVVIAILIASPLAWFVMHKWLEDFAYRTTIGWTVFLVTSLLALMIAILTISFQALRAGIANPVKSLRTE